MASMTHPPRPWRGLLPTLAALLTACGGGGGSATAAPAPAPAPVPSNSWTLVWSDEFDGPAGTVPSTANWKTAPATVWTNWISQIFDSGSACHSA